MRVMVLAKTTDDSEKGILPTNEMLEAICKYNEELINAGIMRAGDGLKPSSQASVLRSMAPVALSSTGLSAKPASWSPASGWEVKDMEEAVA